MWAERPDFGEVEAARLRVPPPRAGVRGLKVWKTLGLRARDPAGRLVAGGRCAARSAVGGGRGPAPAVTIHVADPIAFFDPLDADERALRGAAARTRTGTSGRPVPPGDRTMDGFPPFDELIDGLEAVVARHPGTTFIGAHVGCAAEDLGRVDRMLAAYPNWHVDIAARIAELGRQPC